MRWPMIVSSSILTIYHGATVQQQEGRTAMAIEKLAQLAEEITLREMAEARVIERKHNEASWDITEKGWEWMIMLGRTAMKNAKFVELLELARRVHASAKH